MFLEILPYVLGFLAFVFFFGAIVLSFVLLYVVSNGSFDASNVELKDEVA